MSTAATTQFANGLRRVDPLMLQATTEPLSDDTVRVLVNGEISRSEYGEALRQAGRLLASDSVKLSVAVVLTRDAGAGSGR